MPSLSLFFVKHGAVVWSLNQNWNTKANHQWKSWNNKDGKMVRQGPRWGRPCTLTPPPPLKPTPASDYYWCTYSWPNLPTKKINLEYSCKAIFLDSSAEEIFLDSSGEEIFLDSSAEDIFLDSFGEEISLDSSAEEIFLDSSGEEMERPRLWLAGGWLPCSRMARQPAWMLPWPLPHHANRFYRICHRDLSLLLHGSV